ncbi:hypothetical protein DIPPA_25459 [Diplonema papillatum]|nr:hypothetical protein DIPPA_25459 [Diplonema papillatum]
MFQQFGGFEDWDRWRPMAMKCSFACVSVFAVIGAGMIGLELVKSVEEKNDWHDKIAGMQTEVPCTAKPDRYGLEEMEYGDECDGEPCPDEYRSWVEVNFTQLENTYVEKCWSHIDDTYEQSRSVAQKFIDTYGTDDAGKTFTCCVNFDSSPPKPRFCDWDTRDPQVGKATIVGIVFIGIFVLFTSVGAILHFGGWCEMDTVGNDDDHEMMDDWSEDVD